MRRTTLMYTCFPLASGRCYLPRLRIHKRLQGQSHALPPSSSMASIAEEANAAASTEGEEIGVVALGAGQKDGALYVYVRPRVDNVF
ncbi:hypothetical protein BC829DRAFT_393922 [Chytridium lagenaria]|nr:hypothetical protein BC829DRAFT_393922 [Chytridium lagenaria]